MTTTAHEAWDSLERPWTECLELAWEAHSVGTVPVGAVLVDPHGDVAATGRNAVYEREERLRRLNLSLLAHAEINALLHLDPELRYEAYTLYASLEPCPMCIGAAAVTSVGSVRYAGVDPYGGAARFIARNRSVDRLGFKVEGPLRGPFGRLAAALHMEFYLRRKPTGHVVKAYRDAEPAIVGVAEELAACGTARASAAGTSLREFLPTIWDALTRDPEPYLRGWVGYDRGVRE